MTEAEKPFKPPFPEPIKTKKKVISNFFNSRYSWIHSLTERAYKAKLGRTKIAKLEIFLANDRDVVKRMLKTNWQDFPKHHINDEVLRPLLGESIFTTNGETWRRQRDMIDPAFVHARLKTVYSLMDDAVKEMLERFGKFDESNPENVDVEMTHVTADVIFRTIFSKPISAEEAEEIYLAFNDFQEVAQRMFTFKEYGLPTFFLRRKSLKYATKIRRILANVIKVRYDNFHSGKDEGKDDILTTLMQSKDKNTGEKFSYQELVDHICMLFLAGHETSASALTWSLYLIAKCPHIQQGMYDEVNSIVGDKELVFEDIKKLKTTQDVFKEALRLYPPVGSFVRESAKDQCIRDKNVKKGSTMIVSPWLIHRHNDQWEDPHYFKPERFRDENSKESIKCSYIPFGSGPRVCIGQGFAMQEAMMVLASLVKNFEFTNKEGHDPQPLGRVTIRPEGGVYLHVKKRSS